jgi:vacuolar-type H+-ATPase subunit I/STV1
MMHEIQEELVRPYLKATATNAASATTHDSAHNNSSNNSSNNNNNNNNNANARTSSPTSVAFLEERGEEISLILASTNKYKKELVQLLRHQLEMMQRTEQIQRSIHLKQLPEKLSNVEKELESHTKELEDEKRRLRLTKEALHQARTKSACQAQEIADKVGFECHGVVFALNC